MTPEWLRFKKYPHIGLPLTREKDSAWVKAYVTNPEKIATHKFVPLIHRTLFQRKYRPVKEAEKTVGGKRMRTVHDKKEREIFFCSHLDSIVYGYYSHTITKAYEDYLKDKPFGKAAVAYRKIPLCELKKGNKSNIEFAFEAFDFIEKNKHRKLSIIVADITSFFDNLDHYILHRQWCKVLGVQKLPNDHYTVYRNLILKRYVNENELFKRFKKRLIIERFKPHDTSESVYRRKHVRKIYNMRHEKVVAYCEKEEFVKDAIDLIRVIKPVDNRKRKKRGLHTFKGIPQGTPISSTLANVYMLDFDESIFNAANNLSKNAYYQRYSDDLIIVCDREDESHFLDLVRKEVEDHANLDIQLKKTKLYHYEVNNLGEFKGGVIESGILNPNKQLEYLGFVYDGSKVRVKSAAFSKFYRNMKRSFRRGAHFAKKAHTPSDSLFETRLYKRFTHLGSKRRLRWLPDPDSPTGYKKSKQYDWGNFISYLNKANDIMKEINGEETIKAQSRRVWRKFHDIRKDTKANIENAVLKRTLKA